MVLIIRVCIIGFNYEHTPMIVRVSFNSMIKSPIFMELIISTGHEETLIFIELLIENSYVPKTGERNINLSKYLPGCLMSTSSVFLASIDNDLSDLLEIFSFEIS